MKADQPATAAGEDDDRMAFQDSGPAAFVTPTSGWYSFNGGAPVKLTDDEAAAMRQHGWADAVVVEFDTDTPTD